MKGNSHMFSITTDNRKAGYEGRMIDQMLINRKVNENMKMEFTSARVVNTDDSIVNNNKQ
jgi:hypothetical protein